MIAFLAGKVLEILGDRVIIKLPSGVGYLVTINKSHRFIKNEHVEMYILEVIRENGRELYGFKFIEERAWVQKLQKVSGVGPKSAAQIIFTLGPDTLKSVIESSDTKTLSSVKGLGAKTAKKIVVELKEGLLDINQLTPDNSMNAPMVQEFTEALSTLGYRRTDIIGAINHLKSSTDWDTSDLSHTIRAGLRYLSK